MKKNTKIKFLLILALFVLFIFNSHSVVNADTTYKSGDYSYTVSNNKAKITKYDGSSSTVNIPSKLDKYTVAEIGYQAFENCKEIENITIPESIEKIDEFAFSGCNFTTVKFADNCKITEFGGFADMSNLKSINIPNNVKKINASALRNAKALKTITISSSVTEIDYCAFQNCTGISTMNIPTNVSKIDEYAFSGCNFTTVKFADNCKITEFGGFRDMSNLKSINIPNNVKKIAAYALRNDKALKTITIPASVVEIDYCAFQNCTGLSTITIPRRVEKIDEYAFSGCEFNTIKFENDCMITEFPMFYDMTTLKGINIPRSVSSINNSTFRGDVGLSEIIIPSSVKKIEYQTFKGCSNITITIPSNVTEIDEYAFDNTSGLKVKCESGSYAHEYCQKHNINFELITIEKPKTPIDIGECNITGYEAQTYTGKEIKPNLTIKYGNKTLSNGKDYVVEYEDNINIGTAKLTVVGFGDYIGKVEKYFKIIQAPEKKDSNTNITFQDNYIKTGKTITIMQNSNGKSVASIDLAANTVKTAIENKYKGIKISSELKGNIGTGTTVKLSNGEKITVIYKGDVNGDGKVSIADAGKMVRVSFGKVKLTEAQKKAGDIGGSKDQVNSADAGVVVRLLFGGSNSTKAFSKMSEFMPK